MGLRQDPRLGHQGGDGAALTPDFDLAGVVTANAIADVGRHGLWIRQYIYRTNSPRDEASLRFSLVHVRIICPRKRINQPTGDRLLESIS
jgi:hypothetical protein